jgi:hypothetical protein
MMMIRKKEKKTTLCLFNISKHTCKYLTIRDGIFVDNITTNKKKKLERKTNKRKSF